MAGSKAPWRYQLRPALQEAFIHSLDEATGASLKLSILNPRGRIWTMVAGAALEPCSCDANAGSVLACTALFVVRRLLTAHSAPLQLPETLPVATRPNPCALCARRRRLRHLC
jgi:hypothetical protein